MPDVRLIDADALCRKISESIRQANEWEDEAREKKDTHGVKCAIDTRRSLISMLSRVKEEPTIDAQPVKHGKWVDYGSGVGMYCSECRHRIRYRNGIRETTKFSDGEFEFVQYASKNGYYNFCPKCGSFNGGK